MKAENTILNKFFPDFNSSKNYTEDYEGEIGGYLNKCGECEVNFLGHKFRRICKECLNELKNN